MAEGTKPIFESLLALSKADGALAQIAAQRLTMEKELQARKAALSKIEFEVAARLKVLEDKRGLCRMEEKNIGEERHHLAERKKALKTLGTYKLQQAAERESDQTARQISQREDGLLKMLSEAEAYEKELAVVQQKLATLKADLEKYDQEVKATLITLEENSKLHTAARDEIVPRLDPATMSTYGRVRDKHPGSAVVSAANNSCAGCYMQLGPQVIVQISRGQALQRCPGCGRILYLP